MSEKHRIENSDLDFSKLEGQQRFDQLSQEEKDRLASNAQDEANLMEAEIDSEKPEFVSEVVEITGNEKTDLTKEPFKDLDSMAEERVSYYKKDDPNIRVGFPNGVPDNVKDDYIVKKESLNLNINFKNIAPFEARYVVYAQATYGEIIKKMKELGWDTPTLEQAILFSAKDKTFNLLIVIDEKRGGEFSIDSRLISSGDRKDYDFGGGLGNIDLEEQAVPDRDILFVRAKQSKDNKK